MRLAGIPALLKLSAQALICASLASACLHRTPDATAAQESGPQKGAAYQFEKVREWRTACVKHDAGKPDDAAKEIGRWSIQDLELVTNYVAKLTAQPKSAVKRTLAKARIRRAVDVTDREARDGDLSRVAKQGAMLHTDIALWELQAWAYPDAGEASGAFVDGRILIQPKRYHWEFARRLIDSVSHRLAKDSMVHQWYIATTAHMLNHRFLGHAGQNLKRALEHFPSDERIQFYAGALHEIWASPVNQNIALPKGGKVNFGTKEAELKLAQYFLQKAVMSNPTFAEARLRLGRVLGLTGNHKQATAELQQAADSLRDPQLSYYASLFLGYEFWRLNRTGEAREQYERAATLYPNAQSPLLALSQMARLDGNANEALRTLQRIFDLPRLDPWDDDPWWTYDLAHVRDAEALVAAMQKAFGGLPR